MKYFLDLLTFLAFSKFFYALVGIWYGYFYKGSIEVFSQKSVFWSYPAIIDVLFASLFIYYQFTRRDIKDRFKNFAGLAIGAFIFNFLFWGILPKYL